MRQLDILRAGFALIVLAGSVSAQQSIQPRMGEALPGLTPAQLSRFLAGKAEFNAPLPVESGRGPIFNDTSCAGCHSGPDAGGSSQVFVTRFGQSGNPFNPLAELGGSLLQAEANSDECEEHIPAEADVTAQRITPPTFGFGLIEAIDDSDIAIREIFPPEGVNGRVHWVTAFEDPNQTPRVGRFGWKSQVATVLTFSADASLNEMGLTNRFLTEENAPNGNAALLAQCDLVADPEDGPDAEGFHRIDRQTDFQRFLAAPPQTPRSGMTGETLFSNIGCTACHVNSSYTTNNAPEDAISQKSLKPYSDFLLHDVGSLGDGIAQGDAGETEFRTPPLWGLRSRASVALLHDGRATGGDAFQNIVSAINWHDGEAAISRDQFNNLSLAEQEQIINFLDSLGRAEFDAEGDNDVDDIDWFFIEPFFTGPVSTYTPNDSPSLSDFDQDGDIDLVDFGWMQRALGGPSH